MKTHTKIIIGVSVIALLAVVYMASKKNKQGENIQSDEDFINLMKKIDDAKK